MLHPKITCRYGDIRTLKRNHSIAYLIYKMLLYLITFYISSIECYDYRLVLSRRSCCTCISGSFSCSPGICEGWLMLMSWRLILFSRIRIPFSFVYDVHMTWPLETALTISGTLWPVFAWLLVAYENGCFQVSDPKAQVAAENIGSHLPKSPKSPWMPFPMLFAAISNKVPSSKMNLVSNNYELFRVWPKLQI